MKYHKYKIFIGSIHDDRANKLENPLSDILPKSQLRSLSNQQDSNTVIYLNTLIESEDDEGVYQCIDPSLGDFNIQNITVHVKSK